MSQIQQKNHRLEQIEQEIQQYRRILSDISPNQPHKNKKYQQKNQKLDEVQHPLKTQQHMNILSKLLSYGILLCLKYITNLETLDTLQKLKNESINASPHITKENKSYLQLKLENLKKIKLKNINSQFLQEKANKNDIYLQKQYSNINKQKQQLKININNNKLRKNFSSYQLANSNLQTSKKRNKSTQQIVIDHSLKSKNDNKTEKVISSSHTMLDQLKNATKIYSKLQQTSNGYFKEKQQVSNKQLFLNQKNILKVNKNNFGEFMLTKKNELNKFLNLNSNKENSMHQKIKVNCYEKEIDLQQVSNNEKDIKDWKAYGLFIAQSYQDLQIKFKELLQLKQNDQLKILQLKEEISTLQNQIEHFRSEKKCQFDSSNDVENYQLKIKILNEQSANYFPSSDSGTQQQNQEQLEEKIYQLEYENQTFRQEIKDSRKQSEKLANELIQLRTQNGFSDQKKNEICMNRSTSLKCFNQNSSQKSFISESMNQKKSGEHICSFRQSKIDNKNQLIQKYLIDYDANDKCIIQDEEHQDYLNKLKLFITKQSENLFTTNNFM